jgi:uncharacterized membrane protein
MTFLNIATVVCIGLLVGTEFAVSAFVDPVLAKLDDRAQAEAIRMFARNLGTAMPIWYGLSLALLVLEAVFHWHDSGVSMLIVSAGIWAAVIVLTLLFLVPIKNRMAQIEAGSWSEEARKQHDRWDRLHRIRVVALGTAMVCFLLAIHV